MFPWCSTSSLHRWTSFHHEPHCSTDRFHPAHNSRWSWARWRARLSPAAPSSRTPPGSRRSWSQCFWRTLRRSHRLPADGWAGRRNARSLSPTGTRIWICHISVWGEHLVRTGEAVKTVAGVKQLNLERWRSWRGVHGRTSHLQVVEHNINEMASPPTPPPPSLLASPQRASLCRRRPSLCWSCSWSSSFLTGSACRLCPCPPSSGRCITNWEVLDARKEMLCKKGFYVCDHSCGSVEAKFNTVWSPKCY